MNSNKIKKVIGLFVAMVLVCVASVAGTLAVLKAETDGVVNTFTPTTHLMDDNDKFKVTETVDTLTLTPLAVITKNAVVTTGEFQTDAVVYLEVAVTNNRATISEVEKDILTFGIDAHWVDTGELGVYGGKLYVYAPGGDCVVNKDATLSNVGILLDDKVTVVDYTDGEVTISPTIAFYGYAVQSLYAGGTVTDVESAYEAWDGVWDSYQPAP